MIALGQAILSSTLLESFIFNVYIQFIYDTKCIHVCDHATALQEYYGHLTLTD